MPEPPTSDFGEPRPAGPRPEPPGGEGSGGGDSADSLLGRRLDEVVDRAVGRERLQTWEDRVLRGTVGEWKVEELLDCGGQGAVFRGKRVFTDDPSRVGPSVAIKVVEPNDGGELAHDLRKEADKLFRFTHRNIVHVFDFGQEGSAFWMAMQLLEGQTLDRRLDRAAGGKLPAAEACRIAGEVLSALEKIHAQGMAHLDMKPSNVFLTSDGEVKVLDLGLARYCHPVVGTPDLGVPRGTLGYAAPEQLADEPRGDSRSDVYSLGATLFHMLTGQRPFGEARGLFEVRRAQQAPLPANSNLPDGCAEVIRRAMAREPGERYQTASEFAGALRRALDAGPPPAPRRRRRPVILLGAVMIALVAVTLAAVASRSGVLEGVAAHSARAEGGGIIPVATVPAEGQHGAYHGDINIRVSEEGNRFRNGVPLEELGDLGGPSLRPGQRIWITAHVRPAAYIYLVWIEATAKAKPLYPWKDGAWEERRAEEKRDQYDSDWSRPLKPGKTGVETLLLLARDRPLDSDENTQLADAFRELPKQDSDLFRVLWLENFAEVTNEPNRIAVRTAPEFAGAKEQDDAVKRTHRLLAERLRGTIPYSRGVCFEFRGE